MGQSGSVVTSGVRDGKHLPDWASQYAAFVNAMREAGELDELLRQLRIRRSGYAGMDAFLFLLLYFTAGREGGFKGLSLAAQKWTGPLGALAQRRRLMTQSSLSRLLLAVGASHVGEDFMRWLLVEAGGCGELFSEPTTWIRSSTGRPWRFFDFDGTLLVLRKRGLPRCESLPEPEERTDASFADHGYSGRKRGEVQLVRETLQDAGSGLWLGVWCSPGNGGKQDVTQAAAAMVSGVMRDYAANQRAVLRFDGAYGSWKTIEACVAEGVGYLTRWNKYGILNSPEVANIRSDESYWTRVEDSRSGPVRYAADCGFLEHDGHRARLVCSRYLDVTGAGVGHSIGGWRYELFVTSMPADEWSADQVVTQYYGRVGQENRFGQEDKELGLDRIFSTNISGQALASLVGLFVWNFQTVAGWRVNRDTIDPPPKQKARQAEVQPAMLDEAAPQSNALVELLDEAVEWSSLPAGWTHPSGSALVCPAGRPMQVKRVSTRVIFRASRGACLDCPVRATCTDSVNPRFRREMTLPFDANSNEDVANKIRALKRRGISLTKTKSASLADAKPSGGEWSPPVPAPTYPRAVVGPFLLPSELRRAFRQAVVEIAVRVHLACPPRLLEPRFTAFSPARRQRRRRTWQERSAWNALPHDATTHITFAGWKPQRTHRLLESIKFKSQPIEKAG